MNWNQTVGKLPDDNRIVDIQGILTSKATWNSEKNTWELTENSKINCEVTHWKEIEDGCSKGQSICQGTD